jgi:hypothetical protein
MTRPRAVREPAILLILLTAAALSSGAGEPDTGQFQYIREYLSEFSIVTDGTATGPRDVVLTRLEPHPDPGRAVLMYRRASYAGSGEKSLESQQTIHYTLALGDISANSIRIQTWEGSHSKHTFQLVSAVVEESAELVPYTNVFERKLDDGTVDVTSSRGRVRELVLGYFADETAAARLADEFRGMLEELAR